MQEFPKQIVIWEYFAFLRIKLPAYYFIPQELGAD